MSELLQDLRFGVRTLVRRPGFAAVVVLTLGLGIGANTAIFSVVDAVLLRPLPYPEPERLVLIWDRLEATGFSTAPVPAPDVVDYREGTTAFDGIAAMNNTPTLNLTGEGPPEEAHVSFATPNLFRVLGVEPALGRGFVPEDAAPPPPASFQPGGAPPPTVVVISHGLWQRRFGGDPDILGRTLKVGAFPATIVGVMPADFRLYMPAAAGMSTDIDLWAPLRFDLSAAARDNAFLRVVGRLADGATVQQAQAELDAIAARQRERFAYHRDLEVHIDVRPLHADVVSHVRPVLFTLQGAVAFVLLIACANVAGLLLVRAAGREREVAIRAAVGGDRRRIVRQLLTESALLALGGAGFGLLIARWGIDVLAALRPGDLPRVDEIGIDGSVLLFTLGAAAVSALLFGALPAIQASRPDLQSSLRDRGSVSPDARRRRARGLLVVAEVALSVVLLIGAGLMLRSFVHLLDEDPGFDPAGIETFRLSLPFDRYPSVEDRVRFYHELVAELEAVPGVERAGATFPLPLGGRFWTGPYATEASEAGAFNRTEANYRVVSPGFLETMRTPLLEGRLLTPADDREGRAVAVVDRRMAERNWPGKSAVGRKVDIAILAAGNRRQQVEVVGVVEHVRHDDLASDGRETIYFPHGLQGAFGGLTVVVRAAGDPAGIVPRIRDVVASRDSDLPVAGLRTMEDYVADALAPTRFALLLIGTFAAVAVVLASVGLYGVVSSSVRQRTQEIGVHMAFGAGGGDILRLVLGRGLTLAAAGVVLGLLAALLLSRLFAGLLAGVSATDPATFAAVAVLLTLVAGIASWLPARRALRVDPMVALRYE